MTLAEVKGSNDGRPWEVCSTGLLKDIREDDSVEVSLVWISGSCAASRNKDLSGGPP